MEETMETSITGIVSTSQNITGEKRRRRGPYRQGQKIPRQTVYSRKIRCHNHKGEGGQCNEEEPLNISNGLGGILDGDYHDTLESDDDIIDKQNDDDDEGATGSQNDSMDKHQHQRLYDGCEITSHSACLLIKSFAYRHQLSGQAQTDLLRLFQLMLPKPNTLPPSLYLFRKGENITEEIVRHYYCTRCFALIINPESTSVCTNSSCRAEFQRDTTNFFIELNIEQQLKTLLSRPGFINLLQYRQEKSNDFIEDIHDGTIYRELAKPGGPLSIPGNISLTLNTDGVDDIFHATTYSLWPVFLSINELSPSQRKRQENVILAALWFGKSKPKMSTYLEPILNSLMALETEGVLIEFPDTEEIRTVHAYTICFTADLPARASVQNMMQYNGFYGCSFCEQPGETVQTSLRGHVHAFPFDPNDPDGPRREHDKVILCSIQALQKNEAVYGIKGPSGLFCLKYFDVVWGTSVEYMHCVMLGVVKTLLSLWIDPAKSRGTLHDIEPDLHLIDQRIAQIQVPTEMPRKPRSIIEHLGDWKASEYRAWLLFYSVPVLQGILDESYLHHYILLVEAIWTLLQDSISAQDLVDAQNSLQIFCLQFAAFYEKRYMTIKVHQLLHLIDCVKHLGPLWAHSCFPFENLNGRIKRMFHGTCNPHLQMMKAVRQMQQISQGSDKLPTELAGYCKDMTSHMSNRYSITFEFGGHKVLGKIVRNNSSGICSSDLNVLGSVDTTKMITYQRILISGQVFDSTSSQSTMKNDHTICYETNSKEDEYGVITKYVSYCEVGCELHQAEGYCHHKAVINQLDCSLWIMKHVLVATPSSSVIRTPSTMCTKAVSLDKIKCKCVYIHFSSASKTSVEDQFFLAKLPNMKERDL